MAKRVRTVLIVAAVIVAGIGTLALVGYRAMEHVPTFYEEALRNDPAVDRESSHTMQRKMTALAGDTMHDGRWQALFTSQQINGYLAVDLAEKHPRLLPSQVRDPRVVIQKDGLYVGWRYEGRWESTVYSICLVPYMVSPNVIGVRIRHIRAGAVPVPLGQVLDGLSAAARESGLKLQWRQEDGDPVAIVELPATSDESSRELVLDEITLQDDAIALKGHSQRHGENGSTATLLLPGMRLGEHSGEYENRQR